MQICKYANAQNILNAQNVLPEEFFKTIQEYMDEDKAQDWRR
jgi:hypothetical protein